ncbi:sodium channel subunit beta-4-like [Narcine bancroftii]|uniref:sodium channel subunit beta-4-like n=1 Tax=Narcine bancroftii TaxID=1343680 RepID=UPI003832008C
MATGEAPLDLVGNESARISLSRLVVVILIGFFLFHINLGLEVNIGKLPTITVVNGSDVILPCTFASCMDYKDASFWWNFQKNKTSSAQKIIHIKLKGKKPFVTEYLDSRIVLAGDVKAKNISLLLTNVDFDDMGFYTCFFKNPQEKHQETNATLQLVVVSELLPVDNRLTILILSIVGGVIGFLILIFIIKKIVRFIIKQVGKKKKECLVNSCANTEHGHYGSKANLKSPPKA